MSKADWPSTKLMQLWAIFPLSQRSLVRLSVMSLATAGLGFALRINTGTDPKCYIYMVNPAAYYDILSILFITYFGSILYFTAICTPFYNAVLALFYLGFTLFGHFFILVLLGIGLHFCNIFNTDDYENALVFAALTSCGLVTSIVAFNHQFQNDVIRFDCKAAKQLANLDEEKDLP